MREPELEEALWSGLQTPVLTGPDTTLEVVT